MGVCSVPSPSQSCCFKFVSVCVPFLVSFVSQVCVWFGLRFYVPVNSYGYVETVSSPNHSFSCVSLIKRLTSTWCNTFTCI